MCFVVMPARLRSAGMLTASAAANKLSVLQLHLLDSTAGKPSFR